MVLRQSQRATKLVVTLNTSGVMFAGTLMMIHLDHGAKPQNMEHMTTATSLTAVCLSDIECIKCVFPQGIYWKHILSPHYVSSVLRILSTRSQNRGC